MGSVTRVTGGVGGALPASSTLTEAFSLTVSAVWARVDWLSELGMPVGTGDDIWLGSEQPKTKV